MTNYRMVALCKKGPLGQEGLEGGGWGDTTLKERQKSRLSLVHKRMQNICLVNIEINCQLFLPETDSSA